MGFARNGLGWSIVCVLPVFLVVVENLDAQQPALAITNVNVIDVAAGVVQPDRTILIAEGRIIGVASGSNAALPDGIERVQGAGLYVMPGLLDMHAHVPSFVGLARRVLPLFVANGVTGIREMSSDSWRKSPLSNQIEAMKSLATRIEDGELIGPRILQTSTGAVHGPVRIRPNTSPQKSAHPFYPPKTEADGRSIARYAKEHGIDFVKVYESVPRNVYFALLDEARKLGVEVNGHLPKAIGLLEASAAGQRTVEHARALPLACSAVAEEYRQAVDAFLAGQTPWSDAARLHSHLSDVLATYDGDLAQTVLHTLKKNETYLVPTHITRRMDAMAADSDYRDDPRLSYMHGILRANWKKDADRMAELGKTAPFVEFYKHGLRLTGLAHKAGVKIMMGTDATDTYCFPGFGAHDELGELVKAGLSPLDALRSATIVPAEYLGMQANVGTVTKGAFADLVILEKNPLEDIAHTQAIRAVVIRGKHLDRAALDEMLESLESKRPK